MKHNYIGLIGDVGGTHARFALLDGQGHVRNPKTLDCKDYPSLIAAMEAYLKLTMGGRYPPRAVLAVAGPVRDGETEFTNLDWVVSEGDLLTHFELEAVELINDFAAQALACPRLDPENLRSIGPKLKGVDGCPILVLGAGSGFGVAGLARSERGEIAVSTEGGHGSFAPTDELEVELWRRLAQRYGRVSIERVLSGPGIFDLYAALGQIENAPAEARDQLAVFEAAEAGDGLAGRALDRFCAILGSVAGDLALSFGARGGVYISGGIAPTMSQRLAAGGFRARFQDKGRLSGYVRDIPTLLVLHPYPALVGAARELMRMERP